MSCLRLDRVRLAADENTHISEPEEPQTLKSRSALLAATWVRLDPTQGLVGGQFKFSSFFFG